MPKGRNTSRRNKQNTLRTTVTNDLFGPGGQHWVRGNTTQERWETVARNTDPRVPNTRNARLDTSRRGAPTTSPRPLLRSRRQPSNTGRRTYSTRAR